MCVLMRVYVYDVYLVNIVMWVSLLLLCYPYYKWRIPGISVKLYVKILLYVY
jgi:hypothetical protein